MGASLFRELPRESWMQPGGVYLEVPYEDRDISDAMFAIDVTYHAGAYSTVMMSGSDGETTTIPPAALPGLIAALQEIQKKTGA